MLFPSELLVLKGFKIAPFSNQNSVDQIIDITLKETLALQLRVNWRYLPNEWLLLSEHALIVNEKRVAFIIPLRDEVLAASEGHRFTNFTKNRVMSVPPKSGRDG